MLKPSDICFPVYPIRKYEKITYGSKGAVFIEDKQGDLYLIDDKSKEGSFGQRRLKIKLQLEKSKTIKLYKLRIAYMNWAEFLGNIRKNPSKTYIDNTGAIFKYAPKQYVPLKYYRISKIQQIEGKHCYLILDGIVQKIKIPRPPPEVAKWAGILFSPTGYLLYSYSEQKLPDTIRKV
jgi:hypothetical protein